MHVELAALQVRINRDEINEIVSEHIPEELREEAYSYGEWEESVYIDRYGNVQADVTLNLSRHLDVSDVEEMVRQWATDNFDPSDLDFPLCSMSKSADYDSDAGAFVFGYNMPSEPVDLENQVRNLNARIEQYLESSRVTQKRLDLIEQLRQLFNTWHDTTDRIAEVDTQVMGQLLDGIRWGDEDRMVRHTEAITEITNKVRSGDQSAWITPMYQRKDGV